MNKKTMDVFLNIPVTKTFKFRNDFHNSPNKRKNRAKTLI